MKVLIWLATYFVGAIIMVVGDLLFVILTGGKFAMGYFFDIGIFVLCGFFSDRLCRKWDIRKQRRLKLKMEREKSTDLPESEINCVNRMKFNAIDNKAKFKRISLFVISFCVLFALVFVILIFSLPEIEKIKMETIDTYPCYTTDKNNCYHNLSCTELDGNCRYTYVYDAEEQGYSECAKCDIDGGVIHSFEKEICYRTKNYSLALIISTCVSIVIIGISALIYIIYKKRKNKIKMEDTKKNQTVTTISKLQFTKNYESNSKRLLDICRDLIDKYEGEDSMTPSCKDDLMESIEDQVCRAKEEISQWKDFETDYIRVAHTMLANTTFDLLASGKYNLYTGVLNPMKCGQQLLNIYDSSMKWAVDRKEIDETSRIEQREYLMKCISQVG